jgi:sentrin-specific protease 1
MDLQCRMYQRQVCLSSFHDLDEVTDDQNLLSYIRDEHQDKKGSPFDTSDWECTNAKVRTPTLVSLCATDEQKAPQQNNGSDCGIFTCQTLELVARGADPIDKGFEFSQANMPFFRQLMTYETATGKLKKRW